MTTWVEMYHPALPGTPHVRASVQAVAEYAARGWLEVDGSTPAPVDIYLTPGVGDLRYTKLGDVGNPATLTGAALRAALGLPAVTTVTTSGALVAQKHNPVDATGGAKTMTLPTGAAAGVLLAVEKVDSSTNTVTVTGSVRGVGSSSITLPWQHETLLLVADSAGSWWPVAGHKTKTALDAAYVSRQKVSTPQPFKTVTRNLTGALHAVCGIDTVRGQVIAWDRNNANFSLSDDWGNTWQNLAGTPANVSNSPPYWKTVRFGTYLYSMHVDSTDGLLGIYRAPSAAAATGALSWSTRLVTMSANIGPGVTGISTAFNAGATAMCLGDYGDFTSGPKIQRTTDGTTWTTVYGPDATSRHVHAVVEDPYHHGTWYALLGDTSNTKTMLRSTDDALTWSTIISATNSNQWSGVQISFDANYVYVASDRPGLTAWYMDRTELVPRSVATNYHYNVAVPGGAAGRVITDLATTSGSGTVTSAASSFTALDRGKQVTQVSQFKQGTFVSGVTNGTTLTLTNDIVTGGGNAASTATGQTAYLEGDRFLAIAFMGAVDPATGVFYSVPVDTSFKGNTNGVLYCPQIGGRFEVLDSTPTTFGMDAAEVYIGGGKVFVGRNSFPALSF